MSDEVLQTAGEAGAHDEILEGDDSVTPSWGRGEARDKPRVGVGAALSVLWWSEDGAPNEG